MTDFAQHFDDVPFESLTKAEAEAKASGRKLFLFIYDPSEALRVRADWGLMHMMTYGTTRKLVAEKAVVCVSPSGAKQVEKFLTESDHLELPLWIVINGKGEIERRENVYPNPDEGLKRVQQAVA